MGWLVNAQADARRAVAGRAVRNIRGIPMHVRFVRVFAKPEDVSTGHQHQITSEDDMKTIEEFRQEKMRVEIEIGKMLTKLSNDFGCKVSVRECELSTTQLGQRRSFVYQSIIEASF